METDRRLMQVVLLMKYSVIQIKRAVIHFAAFAFAVAEFAACTYRPVGFQLVDYSYLIAHTRIQCLPPSQRNTWHHIHRCSLVDLLELRMQSL